MTDTKTCSYPECGPTCRKDCPPPPAMLVEQDAKIRAEVSGWRFGEDFDPFVPAIARRIAERERTLTTSIMTMWVAERTELSERFDTMRAELQERIDQLEEDTVVYEGCGKRLPHACAIPTEDPVYLCARCVSPMHMERESQTRACVDALEEQLGRFTLGDGFDSDPIEKLRELYPRPTPGDSDDGEAVKDG